MIATRIGAEPSKRAPAARLVARVGAPLALLVAAGAGCFDYQWHLFEPDPSRPVALRFTVDPGQVRAGQRMSPVVVRVVDQRGDVMASPTTVTITLAGGAPGAVLSGRTSRSAPDGMAMFDDLSVNTSAYGYQLVASAPHLISAGSGRFNVLAPTATIAVRPTSRIPYGRRARLERTAAPVTSANGVGGTPFARSGKFDRSGGV
jgi:hypothetical protein